MTQPILKGIPTLSSDWYLYSDKPGVGAVAQHIAQALSDAIRANFTIETALDESARTTARNAVFKVLHKALDEHSDFGATDGEAYDVGARIVNKAFPRVERDFF